MGRSCDKVNWTVDFMFERRWNWGERGSEVGRMSDIQWTVMNRNHDLSLDMWIIELRSSFFFACFQFIAIMHVHTTLTHSHSNTNTHTHKPANNSARLTFPLFLFCIRSIMRSIDLLRVSCKCVSIAIRVDIACAVIEFVDKMIVFPSNIADWI